MKQAGETYVKKMGRQCSTIYTVPYLCCTLVPCGRTQGEEARLMPMKARARSEEISTCVARLKGALALTRVTLPRMAARVPASTRRARPGRCSRRCALWRCGRRPAPPRMPACSREPGRQRGAQARRGLGDRGRRGGGRGRRCREPGSG